MIKLICFLSMIAYATSASVKREEYNPDPLLALTNQVNAMRDQSNVGSNNNSPVYSPNGYPTYSANYGNQAMNQNLASNYASQSDTNANQAYADNVASATNLPSPQSTQPNYSNNNQGNLYYYYYPVQDKSKEVNYQASPSNQYTSSIAQPQNGDEQSNNQNNLANNQQQVSANSQMNNQAHDLSYGAQDLAYTASALNENTNSNGQQQGSQSGNYENQLSNLANAFGFSGGASNGNAFSNPQFTSLNGMNNLNNLNFGEAFGGSSIQPSSVPFVNDPAFSAAMASQLGSFAPATQSTSSGGGPLSQLYQQATQMYQGLINGATSGSASGQPQFAASQQHASYEPSSSSGSSFRSKYGFGSVVLPLMALAGLSLLIPTVTSLSTVASRKKRSADDQQPGLDGYLERIDRYYSLYKNAITLEREDCMNRIICELGEAVSGVKGKDAFFEFVERMMPNGWNKQGNSKISIFKNGALNASNSKCKNYKCH